MRRLAAALVPLAACATAGCGPGPTPLADGCTGDGRSVDRALVAAPRRVALPDGTALSRCIADGTDDAEMQEVGITFHRTAERLYDRLDRGDRGAAVELGYLVGATRRGAARTNGVMAELVRRIELVAGRALDRAPAARADIERGIAAGERLG